MAPFPVYDTDYVKDVKKELDKMEDNIIDYDDLPVVACRYCDNLYIESDAIENDVCMRCGAINEITIFENIFKYKDHVNGKQTEENFEDRT